MVGKKANPNPEREEESSVESLRQDLYQPGATGVKIRGRSYLRPQRVEVPSRWGQPRNTADTEMKKRKKTALGRFSLGQKIFLFSFLIFLFSAGFAFVTFYQNKNTVSSQNIEVVFDHVAFVDGGEELQVSIDVTNKNNAPLVFTNVVLEYPSVTALNENGVGRLDYPLDTLRPGETKTAEFTVVLYGEQGTQNPLETIFQYQVEGSNATFEKRQGSLVTLRSTPVDIVLESRDEIIGSQEETYTFSVISQSEDPLPNLVLQLDLPPGFNVTKATPISLFGNDTWLLGTLDPLEEKTITITGILSGQEGQSKTIRAYVGSGSSSQNGAIATVFNSLSKTVDIVQPFLQANIFVNRSSDDTVSVVAGQKISGTIEWKNTLDEAIKSPEILLFMSGGAFDKEAVEPQSGFYSSSDSRIIWSKETLDSLAVVEPGESGTVRFTLTPRLLSGVGFGSPEVNLRVGVKGVDASGQLRTAEQTDTIKIQIGTVLDVLAESLHYTGPFDNTGAVPPQVGRATDYTVKWTVTNSSNAVERGRITATLPPYVEWAGQTSPASENIRYEPTSRTVIWDVGAINPGAGFGGAGKTAYFQVSITPSLSQIGETADLTSRVSATGIDAYTKRELSTQARAATTRLLNDGANTSQSGGRIVE